MTPPPSVKSTYASFLCFAPFSSFSYWRAFKIKRYFMEINTKQEITHFLETPSVDKHNLLGDIQLFWSL